MRLRAGRAGTLAENVMKQAGYGKWDCPGTTVSACFCSNTPDNQAKPARPAQVLRRKTA
jgi:hypothetical protein